MIDTDSINIQIIGCVEDTIDKLQIAGQIMPLTYEMKSNAKKVGSHFRLCIKQLYSYSKCVFNKSSWRRT